MFKRTRSYLLTGTLILVLLSGCAPAKNVETPSVEKPVTTIEPTPLAEPIPTATEPPSPVTQPTLTPVTFGPQQVDFPPDINPLTGLPVADPSLLEQPAMLLSITHFPPEVRPQAGLSFAPWVFEYLIAAGTTRLAAVFHGQIPYPEAPLTGGCEVRMEPFQQDDLLLGNRVWLDKNADGIQSPEEQGVGGVCVNLYDAGGNLVQKTTTDSNGYYAFNVDPGTYTLEFIKSEDWAFTEPNVGYENSDSDADQATGRTEAVQVKADVRLWDAGLIPLIEPDPADLPSAQVGPIRSARLIHIHLQSFLQDSCLVYAGATDEIEQDIPGCATVFEKGNGGKGSMLDISRFVAISEQNARNKGSDFNYASNLFSENVPAGGQPAGQVDLFFSQLNQSKWAYDPSYQGWLRYVDNTSEQTEFHVDTDRLSGRQIYFDNLLVLFVEHEVLAPRIIDMYLQQGEQGAGFAFRDGKMFEIKWSTRSGEYEKKTGLRRPIAFLDKDGNPFPLRPGRLWIIIATPYSAYTETEPGKWEFRIYAPPGAGDY
jgi:SdrD B-like domain/Protein of unknown function (DUF3048) C-terminal domain